MLDYALIFAFGYFLQVQTYFAVTYQHLNNIALEIYYFYFILLSVSIKFTIK